MIRGSSPTLPCTRSHGTYAEYYWVLPRERPTPHIKICMYHNDDGNPALVLRGELLTIVAAMITRLNKPSLKKHLVFPVCPAFLSFTRKLTNSSYPGYAVFIHG